MMSCGAQFAITLDAPGIVEFDLISMIPEDAVSGIFRKDLFEALQADQTGICAFPGRMYCGRHQSGQSVIIGKIQ